VEGLPNLIPWKKVRGWSCIHCGFCCSEYDIPVTLEEEERLKKYGNVFKRGKIGLYLRKKRGTCVFRSKIGCRIYKDRPMACRKYPFYVKQQGNEDSLFIHDGMEHHVFLDARCSGLGRGDDIEEEIKKVLQVLKNA
jgi:hypothetical protein